MDSVRVAVLGEAGVGKSALTVRSITGRFLHHYDPTLEDEYRCEEKVNGQVVTVAIMDTAGQVSFYYIQRCRGGIVKMHCSEISGGLS